MSEGLWIFGRCDPGPGPGPGSGYNHDTTRYPRCKRYTAPPELEWSDTSTSCKEEMIKIWTAMPGTKMRWCEESYSTCKESSTFRSRQGKFESESRQRDDCLKLLYREQLRTDTASERSDKVLRP